MDTPRSSCATLKSCCDLAQSDHWKAATAALLEIPPVGTVPLAPPEITDLANQVARSPAGFIDAAAGFLRVKDEPGALPWAVLDTLFGHAVAGMELALMDRHWDSFLSYASAALHLPCGTRLRQAILEVTFRSVLAATSSEDSNEVAEMISELLLEIEQSAQYPELVDTLCPGRELGSPVAKPTVRLESTPAAAPRRESTFDQQFICACDELAWPIAADVLAHARPTLDRLALNPELSRAFQTFVTSAPHAAILSVQSVLGYSGDIAPWRTGVLIDLSARHLHWAQRFLDWGDYGLAHAHTAAAILIRGRTQKHESQLSDMVSPFIVALRNQPLPDLAPLTS